MKFYRFSNKAILEAGLTITDQLQIFVQHANQTYHVMYDPYRNGFYNAWHDNGKLIPLENLTGLESVLSSKDWFKDSYRTELYDVAEMRKWLSKFREKEFLRNYFEEYKQQRILDSKVLLSVTPESGVLQTYDNDLKPNGTFTIDRMILNAKMPRFDESNDFVTGGRIYFTLSRDDLCMLSNKKLMVVEGKYIRHFCVQGIVNGIGEEGWTWALVPEINIFTENDTIPLKITEFLDSQKQKKLAIETEIDELFKAI